MASKLPRSTLPRKVCLSSKVPPPSPPSLFRGSEIGVPDPTNNHPVTPTACYRQLSATYWGFRQHVILMRGRRRLAHSRGAPQLMAPDHGSLRVSPFLPHPRRSGAGFDCRFLVDGLGLSGAHLSGGLKAIRSGFWGLRAAARGFLISSLTPTPRLPCRSRSSSRSPARWKTGCSSVTVTGLTRTKSRRRRRL